MTRWDTSGFVAGVVLSLAGVAQGQTNATVSAAVRIGLSPEPLACAGLGSTGTSAVLGAIQAQPAFQSQLAALCQTEASLSDAILPLVDAVHADPTNATARALLESKLAALAQARQGLATTSTALWSCIAQGLPQPQHTALTTCVKNRGRRVPPSFWSKEATPRKWAQIERALIAERRAIRRGEQLETGAASLLAELRASPQVIAAAQNYSGTLAAVLQVWPNGG